LPKGEFYSPFGRKFYLRFCLVSTSIFPYTNTTNIQLLNHAFELGASVTMAGAKKINKAKKREVIINTYEVIAGMDGNPNSPAEFDESPHDDKELFFKADEDATEVCTVHLLSHAKKLSFLSFGASVWCFASFQARKSRSSSSNEQMSKRN
jgi:hypothetical protein